MTEVTPDRDEYKEPEATPVVGLGASAGGLEALCSFFESMPILSGMSFVVVSHLLSGRPSALPEILKRVTNIPVNVISDGVPVISNQIYVLPADYEVEIENNHLKLMPLAKSDGWPNTINRFFNTLAQEKGKQAVAIILSGEGDDGVDGARAIKESGGLVLVQALDSATHNGMPTEIINAEIYDAVLSAGDMAEFLLQYFRIATPTITAFQEVLSQKFTQGDLKLIIGRIRRYSGYDFSQYKESTLRRQIARRMGAHNISSIQEYVELLDRAPSEATLLVNYLLIHVTNFFRDQEAFNILQREALKPLLATLGIDDIFRAWVPGCATGEEAISIAILIYECLKELDMQEMEVRIFATDIDRSNIDFARRGVYPHNITEFMSDQRLQENFIKQGESYEVRNHISNMIVWAEHNLFEHPPFSRLHLISCRNVIIYFERPLQERILALFQFSLRPDGILFLGPSETITQQSNSFAAVDSKHKIYRQTDTSPKGWMQLDRPLFITSTPEPEQPISRKIQSMREPNDSHDLLVIKDMLVDHYNSTCVIVDEHYHVRYTFGEVDRYLRLIPGRAEPRNIVEMAREGLDIELTVALHATYDQDTTIVRQNVWVKTNGHERIINLIVKPIYDPVVADHHRLIIFEPVKNGDDLHEDREETDPELDNTMVVRLREELRQTQEALQRVTQALQAKTEELTSSIEEVRSANEEVQTTNEELRTSKEELESMNEELNTLNTQLADQNKTFSRANDTLSNFLQSTQIGMIFLDQDLLLREYTQAVTPLFGLRENDKGRPLSEIASQLEYEKLTEDATSVLDTLVNVDKELYTSSGQWFHLKIRPYRTTANLIDGLVLTFSDITQQKTAQHEAEAAAIYVKHLLETVEDGVVELDSNLQILTASQSFYETFKVERIQTLGRKLYELGNGQWDIPELRQLLEEIIPQQTIVRDFMVTHDFPELGRRTMRLNARQIEELDRILLVITDVSELVDTEAAS